MYEGLTTADHCVPSGARLIELKQCENCPTHFVRSLCVHPRVERCGCQKYCANCIARVLMPASNVIDFQQELKSIAPQLSKHAVRYDDSMMPNQRGRRPDVSWLTKVVTLFAERGELSVREIAGAIGTTNFADAVSRCHRHGLVVERATKVPGAGTWNTQRYKLVAAQQEPVVMPSAKRPRPSNGHNTMHLASIQ